MASKERIQTHWQAYQSVMLRGKMDSRQMEFCRLAFYAGAQGMQTILLFEIAALPEKQADEALLALEREMGAFAKKVRHDKG